MATTIRVQMANGYRPQVDAYFEAHPGLTRDDATSAWVTERYGAWITENITEEFELVRVTAQDFDVAFQDVEHARAFQAAIGGQPVYSQAEFAAQALQAQGTYSQADIAMKALQAQGAYSQADVATKALQAQAAIGGAEVSDGATR